MRVSLLLSAVLVAACNGPGTSGDDNVDSTDIRIDGAGAGDESIDSQGARMCQADNGNIYAVWYDDREGSNDIWFQASLNRGRSWNSQAIQVNQGDGDATNPDIACIGTTVFVVWEDTRDGELEAKNIYFSKSDSAGTRWLDEDLRLSPDPEAKQDSIGPRIASSGDEMVVVWSDGINGAYDIYAASSTNRGDEFGAAVRVDTDEAGSAFSGFPQVAVDGSGRAIVVWEDARNELNDIYAATSSDSGASFGAEVRLDGGDALGAADSSAVDVALSGGHAYVVWHDDRNGANSDIYMNWSADAGDSWLESAVQVETDGAGAGDSALPQVAMSGTRAHIVWQDNRNAAFDIYYRSFEEGTALTRDDFDNDTAADSEFRVDRGDPAGFSNAINARVAAELETVVVAWEDRRFDGIKYEDPGDTTGTPKQFNDVYYNFSEDGGSTWNGTDDYHVDSYCRGGKWARNVSIDLDGDTLNALWHDGRRGNSDIMFNSAELGTSNAFTPDDVCAESDSSPEQ